MPGEIEPPTSVACPPHYWLIEKQGLHTQHWSCHRCGALKDVEESLVIGYR